jgi:anti-sigma regulatory factor (Ser/Thr protein kinase)
MKLATTKRAEIIRRFLLNSIKAGNSHFLHDAMETFQLTRQSIHGHLTALVKLGYLIADGNTRARTYALGQKRFHRAMFSLKGLQESDVYYRDFGYIFNDLPRELENICHYGFTEMLNNAIDHSGGDAVIVNVDRTAELITIRIDDNGEGIFNHIARIMNLSDPRESLLELSKGKLTTDPDNHTGQGIFFTSRAFDYFLIYSGDLIFSHNDGDINDFLLHNPNDHKGTRVMMRIAMDSQKILKSVFDDFTGNEDEDFVFNKTVVPVKLALYEGERLVSRSQAKRILNRVEKFKTVILDFQDVDFIGQAFADEVFRVFTRRNPQISLIPVHITKDVEQAIQAAKSTS